MDRIEDQLAKLAAKVGLNDEANTENPYRRPEDYIAAIAEYLDDGGSGGGGSFAPDITSPQDGDTLVYNATQQKWVNGAGAGGGGAFIVNVVFGDTDTHLDKTAGEIAAAIDAGKTIYIKQDNSSDSPEHGYTQYTYYPLSQYDYYNSTGTAETPYTYWEFVTINGTYISYALTDYPVILSD